MRSGQEGGFRIPRWNLTRTGAKFRKADVLILSVGKSGRTWLRVLLFKYLSLHTGTAFELGDLRSYGSGIPSILFTHELWEYLGKASHVQRLLGKYIVPPRVLAEKKVVVLYRDPRDVVVSLYFQKAKRSRKRVDVTISGFVRGRTSGVESVVAVMNAWRRRLEDHPDVHWMAYEAMRRETSAELTRLLRFLGVQPVRDDLVREAVDISAFENMKKMEASGAFESAILRPGDLADPQSFKVREGKVGGYRRHFDASDLEFLDRAVARLDPFFGYMPS